ncbi:MAG: hypothetical protein HC819_03465 [Cyclobacteriaceae bacterium]|nr:hypothetical protein [Cyclobacteriaceae bacterium]
MIDEKIPLNLKSRVRVLCAGEHVLWVIGFRMDDRFKISEKTKNALLIINQATHDQPL